MQTDVRKKTVTFQGFYFDLKDPNYVLSSRHKLGNYTSEGHPLWPTSLRFQLCNLLACQCFVYVNY